MRIGTGGHIFVLQPGGPGDVVLLEPLLSALAETHAGASIAVACRQEYAALLALAPRPPREVIPLNFSIPFETEPTPELFQRLKSLDALIGSRWVDLFVSAGRRPHWLTWYLGAKVRPQQTLSAPGWEEPPRGVARALLSHFDLPEIPLNGPAVSSGTHERERMAKLATGAGARVRQGHRAWSLPPGHAELAASRVESLGLETGRYLACFPFSSGPGGRHWPVARYWELLLRLEQECEVPILLITPQGEAAAASQLTGCLDGSRIRTWLADSGDWIEMAGLLASAGWFVGNDSGLSQLAQAFGIPGVVLYGGGEDWQAYAPWGPRVTGFVHPLSCFGCGWNCPFSEAHCLDTVQPDAVVAAVHRMLAGNAPVDPQMEVLSGSPLGLTAADLASVHQHYQGALARGELARELLIELQQSTPRRPGALLTARSAIRRALGSAPN